MGKSVKLYWCSTVDHDEDWFVVARRRSEAIRLFEEHEGYDGDASAQLVCVLPEALQQEPSGWPGRDVLEACGAEIVRWETPRVVALGGVRYVEGMLEHRIREISDDMFEAHGRGRPNRTRGGRVS
jgi:hypothetical protein